MAKGSTKRGAPAYPDARGEGRRTRLYIVRHGQLGMSPDVFYGKMDIDLNDKGHEQARVLGRKVRSMHIDALYSSGMKRAITTAGYISKSKGMSCKRVPQLNEFDFGRWEGLNVEQIKGLYPDEFRIWVSDPDRFRSPGGDSFKGFTDRVTKAMGGLAARHDGKEVMVVCHAGVIRAFLSRILEVSFKATWKVSVDHCGISCVEYDGRKPVVVFWNLK